MSAENEPKHSSYYCTAANFIKFSNTLKCLLSYGDWENDGTIAFNVERGNMSQNEGEIIRDMFKKRKEELKGV